MVLIIGVTMVVQPPIIFGEASQGGTNFDTDYMIGLAFSAVFLASGIDTSIFQLENYQALLW